MLRYVFLSLLTSRTFINSFDLMTFYQDVNNGDTASELGEPHPIEINDDNCICKGIYQNNNIFINMHRNTTRLY